MEDCLDESLEIHEVDMGPTKSPISFLSDVKTIRIPSSITNIGEFGFTDFGHIGNRAFIPPALESITIPSSVISLGSRCFGAAQCLREVTFERGSKVRYIEPYAFSCSRIREIVIPVSVEIIGSGCFYECKDLESVRFSRGSLLRKLGASAFELAKIKKIVLPNAIKEIERDCFRACTIGHMKLCVNGEYVFVHKTAFQHAIIQNLEYEGTGQCTRSFDFAMCEAQLVHRGLRYLYSRIQRFVLPGKVQRIPDLCFYGNKVIRVVDASLCHTLSAIGVKAFASSTLTTIKLTNSVSYIGSRCFQRCKFLRKIEFTEPSYPSYVGFQCLDDTYNVEILNASEETIMRLRDRSLDPRIVYAAEMPTETVEPGYTTVSSRELLRLQKYDSLEIATRSYEKLANEYSPNAFISEMLQNAWVSVMDEGEPSHVDWTSDITLYEYIDITPTDMLMRRPKMWIKEIEDPAGSAVPILLQYIIYPSLLDMPHQPMVAKQIITDEFEKQRQSFSRVKCVFLMNEVTDTHNGEIPYELSRRVDVTQDGCKILYNTYINLKIPLQLKKIISRYNKVSDIQAPVYNSTATTSVSDIIPELVLIKNTSKQKKRKSGWIENLYNSARDWDSHDISQPRAPLQILHKYTLANSSDALSMDANLKAYGKREKDGSYSVKIGKREISLKLAASHIYVLEAQFDSYTISTLDWGSSDSEDVIAILNEMDTRYHNRFELFTQIQFQPCVSLIARNTAGEFAGLLIASCRGDRKISGRDFDGRSQNPYTRTSAIPGQLDKQQACGIIWLCEGTDDIKTNLLHVYMDFCKFAYSVTLFYSLVYASDPELCKFYRSNDFSCIRYARRTRHSDEILYKMELNTRSMGYFLGGKRGAS